MNTLVRFVFISAQGLKKGEAASHLLSVHQMAPWRFRRLGMVWKRIADEDQCESYSQGCHHSPLNSITYMYLPTYILGIILILFVVLQAVAKSAIFSYFVQAPMYLPCNLFSQFWLAGLNRHQLPYGTFSGPYLSPPHHFFSSPKADSSNESTVPYRACTCEKTGSLVPYRYCSIVCPLLPYVFVSYLRNYMVGRKSKKYEIKRERV